MLVFVGCAVSSLRWHRRTRSREVTRVVVEEKEVIVEGTPGDPGSRRHASR